MSREYDLYLVEHKANVMKGFGWLCEHVFTSSGIYVTDYKLERASKNILVHDNSKYSLEEYDPYDFYFYCDNSAVFKDVFDKAWLHHIHENSHHWQHWILVNDDPKLGTVALKMPMEYIIEMICDWWSFSWKSGNLYEIFSWYEKNKDHIIMHDDTRTSVESILQKMRMVLDEDDK